MATLAAFSLTGTALALYYYSHGSAAGSKRKDSNAGAGDASFLVDTHLSLYRAPTSFLEDLYFFVEGLRFFYGETLFKWKTGDLLFGLYYLCQSNGPMSASQLADVGAAGTPFGLEALASGDEAKIEANTVFLRRMERCFRYNSCLRERRPTYRKRRILQKMDIEEGDFLKQATSAGVLKPSYVLVRDHRLRNIVLVVRGTHSIKDAFTSLTGASKPHHVVDSNDVTLGYSHFGMLAAARWLKGELMEALEQALRGTPGYSPLIIGHSLGGGAAAMLTMMLREQGGLFEEAQCLAIACPACMTMELAESCKGYVTSVVNGCDAIPMMSSVSADVLREEVMSSEWYDEFHRDMRQYKIFRAFESTKRWVRTKQSALPNVTILRGCGLEQGDLVSRIRGLVDRLTSRWSGQSSPGVTRSDAECANQCTHGPRREVAEDATDSTDGEDEESSFTDRSRNTAAESLEAEASWRRKAVHDAVLDAEAEERADQEKYSGAVGRHGHRHGRAGREAEPHVPSIIRPGNYGGQSDEWRNTPSSSPSSSSRREGCWKRSMYPAGRIMHFVPAHVVPGYEDSIIEDEEPFVESPVERVGELNDTAWADAEGSGGPSASTALHVRQVSELGFEEIMGGEGAVLHMRTASDSGPLPALKAAPGPPPKNMVLIDNVPQRLYGRMRPSTSILSDHVIPNYVRSLHSFRQRHNF